MLVDTLIKSLKFFVFVSTLFSYRLLITVTCGRHLLIRHRHVTPKLEKHAVTYIYIYDMLKKISNLN